MFSNPADPLSVIEVRRKERAWIERWMREVQSKLDAELTGRVNIKDRALDILNGKIQVHSLRKNIPTAH